MTPLVPVCWVRVAQSVGGADAFEGIFPGNVAVGWIFIEVPLNSNLCHQNTALFQTAMFIWQDVPC